MYLNIDMMAAAYKYFAASKPFSDWNLPPAEDVVFKVAKVKHTYGWYTNAREGRGKNKKLTHYITISVGRNGHTDTFMRTMAHEMVHLVDGHHCLGKSHHGLAFKKLAHEVAKQHGFDPLAF